MQQVTRKNQKEKIYPLGTPFLSLAKTGHCRASSLKQRGKKSKEHKKTYKQKALSDGLLLDLGNKIKREATCVCYMTPEVKNARIS